MKTLYWSELVVLPLLVGILLLVNDSPVSIDCSPLHIKSGDVTRSGYTVDAPLAFIHSLLEQSILIVLIISKGLMLPVTDAITGKAAVFTHRVNDVALSPIGVQWMTANELPVEPNSTIYGIHSTGATRMWTGIHRFAARPSCMGSVENRLALQSTGGNLEHTQVDITNERMTNP